MAEDTGPVLDEASPTTIRKLVPFFKDCGEDNECVTDLALRATMDITGSRQSPHVLRRGRRKVTVTASLENREENAYNASLRLALSPNLLLASLAARVRPRGGPAPAVSPRPAVSPNTHIDHPPGLGSPHCAPWGRWEFEVPLSPYVSSTHPGDV
nr:integrin alpha-10-like [Columba livia]